MMKFSVEDEGHKTTVNELINVMVRHMRDHCDEIREIRRVHGL